MPEEIKDVTRFIELSEGAQICKVKRIKDIVKFKLRTKRRLYTLTADFKDMDEIKSKIKCEIIEI